MTARDEWRWTDERGVQRLVGTDELRAALASSVLPAATLVWREGMKEWAPAFTLPELASAAIAAARSGADGDRTTPTEVEQVPAGRRAEMRTLVGMHAIESKERPSAPILPIVVPGGAGGTQKTRDVITQVPRYGPGSEGEGALPVIPPAPRMPGKQPAPARRAQAVSPASLDAFDKLTEGNKPAAATPASDAIGPKASVLEGVLARARAQSAGRGRTQTMQGVGFPRKRTTSDIDSLWAAPASDELEEIGRAPEPSPSPGASKADDGDATEIKPRASEPSFEDIDVVADPTAPPALATTSPTSQRKPPPPPPAARRPGSMPPAAPSARLHAPLESKQPSLTPRPTGFEAKGPTAPSTVRGQPPPPPKRGSERPPPLAGQAPHAGVPPKRSHPPPPIRSRSPMGMEAVKAADAESADAVVAEASATPAPVGVAKPLPTTPVRVEREGKSEPPKSAAVAALTNTNAARGNATTSKVPAVGAGLNPGLPRGAVTIGPHMGATAPGTLRGLAIGPSAPIADEATHESAKAEGARPAPAAATPEPAAARLPEVALVSTEPARMAAIEAPVAVLVRPPPSRAPVLDEGARVQVSPALIAEAARIEKPSRHPQQALVEPKSLATPPPRELELTPTVPMAPAASSARPAPRAPMESEPPLPSAIATVRPPAGRSVPPIGTAVSVPVSSLMAAGGALIVMAVSGFLFGRCSSPPTTTMRANAGLSGLVAIAREAMPKAPKPCWVVRQPVMWAARASKSTPFELLATPTGALAVGYARDENEAIGLEVDPKSGETKQAFEQKTTDAIERVSPNPSGGFTIATTGDSGELKSPVLVPSKPPFFIGIAGTSIAAADKPDGPSSALWPLEGGESPNAMRIEDAGAKGFGVTFRRDNATWGGWASRDRKAQGALVKVEGSGGAVGKPMSAFNGRDFAVIFADKPAGSDHWEIRVARAAAGSVPATTTVIPLPKGGPGGDAFAPDLAGLADGRWAMVWTEGPPGSKAVRAQTLGSNFEPVGDPIALSPPAGNYGQGVLGVVGNYTAVVFLSRGASSYELWGAVLQCG